MPVFRDADVVVATARAAIANAEALAAANFTGAFTPSSAFGADHVLRIAGVSRVDQKWFDAAHAGCRLRVIHDRPHSTPVPTDVRYASNSGH